MGTALAHRRLQLDDGTERCSQQHRRPGPVRPADYAVVKRMEIDEIKVEDIGISYDTNWISFNQNTGTNPKSHKPFVEPWKLKLFRDVRFRQAVSYAINRDDLINTVFNGRGVPSYTFISPGDKTWSTDDLVKYPHDPARARQLLAEIGLKDTNSDGIVEDPE